MVIIVPEKFTLTLLTYVLLVFVLALSSEAHIQQRDHVNLKRLIKKRALFPQHDQPSVPVADAGASPPVLSPSSTPTSSSSASTSQPTSSSTSSVSQTSATSSASVSSSSSSSSSSISTSSTTGQQSSTTTSKESTSSSNPTSEAINVTSAPETPVTDSKPTLTRTQLIGATGAPTDVPKPQTALKTKSTTLTIIIAVGASVAGVAILWTVFRKWKLGRSSKFDERLQPIDWQPTNVDDGSIPGSHRRHSGASSFHSGSGHGNGYGASEHGHGSDIAPSAYAIPDHDFTAGSSTLAPVGGYADLARGPSPQPQMQQMSRGPSLSRPAYDAGIPLHHQAGYGNQDAYDYSGGPRRY